jgi:hypothetical protein
MKSRFISYLFTIIAFAGLSYGQHIKVFDGKTGLRDESAGATTVSGFVADTGVITLGPNQFLRVTAMVPQRSTVRSVTVTFSRQMNTHGTCNSSGVCVHTVASNTRSEPLIMIPGQGASIDIFPAPNASAVRSEMLMTMEMSPSTRPDVEVNALIIDGNTGVVVASNKLFVGGLSWDSIAETQE